MRPVRRAGGRRALDHRRLRVIVLASAPRAPATRALTRRETARSPPPRSPADRGAACGRRRRSSSGGRRESVATRRSSPASSSPSHRGDERIARARPTAPARSTRCQAARTSSHPVDGRKRQLVARIGDAVARCRRAALPPSAAARNSAWSRAMRGLFFCSRSATAARFAYGANDGGSRSASSHFAILSGASSGFSAGMPKPSSDTSARDALRPHAGVDARDVAAEAVADDARRRVRREMLEQRVEVGDVVGEPVAVGAPLASAEAAPVRREHIPVARERVDQKLERRADVHPAVQHEELRRGGIAPASHVVRQAAHRDELRCRGLHSGSWPRASPRSSLCRHFFLHRKLPSCQPVRYWPSCLETRRVLVLDGCRRSRSRRRSLADRASGKPCRLTLAGGFGLFVGGACGLARRGAARRLARPAAQELGCRDGGDSGGGDATRRRRRRARVASATMARRAVVCKVAIIGVGGGSE